MHTFSHLNVTTYLIAKIGALMLALLLWLVIFSSAAV